MSEGDKGSTRDHRSGRRYDVPEPIKRGSKGYHPKKLEANKLRELYQYWEEVGQEYLTRLDILENDLRNQSFRIPSVKQEEELLNNSQNKWNYFLARINTKKEAIEHIDDAEKITLTDSDECPSEIDEENFRLRLDLVESLESEESDDRSSRTEQYYSEKSSDKEGPTTIKEPIDEETLQFPGFNDSNDEDTTQAWALNRKRSKRKRSKLKRKTVTTDDESSDPDSLKLERGDRRFEHKFPRQRLRFIEPEYDLKVIEPEIDPELEEPDVDDNLQIDRLFQPIDDEYANVYQPGVEF